MSKLKMGRNGEISNEDYHADRKFISSSGLKLLLEDEFEYHNKYIMGAPNEQKNYFDFGTFIHAHILEPETVKDEFAIYPQARRFGAAYTQFKEDNKGKIVITKTEAMQAAEIMMKFGKTKIAKNLITKGFAESTYCATIEGVPVKVRADYITDSYIVDVKTTSKPVTRSGIMQTCNSFSYDLSAALYFDVANMSLEKKMEKFYFMFVCKKTSNIMVAEASKEFMERGRQKYLAAIKKFKRLKEEGFFDTLNVTERIILL